jgi:hypothetical protein
MNSGTRLDSNIPVLTEIISTDSGKESVSNTQGEVSPSKVNSAQDKLHREELLAELEKELHEKVLRQLLTRVDFVLEHRIRDGLAEVLQSSVDDLAQEIRSGLNKSLEELIHRTISQEISKLQSAKSQK